MEKIGLIFDFSMVSHHSHQHPQPELPSRLHKLVDFFLSETSIKESKCLDIVSSCIPCKDEDILMVHSKSYLQMLKDMNFDIKPMFWYLDTFVIKETLDSAYLAVGALIDMIDRVQRSEWKRAFALVRPPGHHMGLIERPNGFCIFNNVAIAAQHLIKNWGVKKVMILDWDVHHGDGTQQIFYDTNQVLFISFHRYDHAEYYPANKQANFDYVGGPLAKGYNINIPWNLLPNQTATTDDYIYIFERILAPIIKSYDPEIILISAGFDSAKGDPLGGLALTNEGYAYMTKRLMDFANGKVIAELEGGYNLINLCQGVHTVLKVLMGEKIDVESILSKIKPNDVGLNACKEAVKVFSDYWPIIKTDEKALSVETRLIQLSEQIKIKGDGFETSGGHANNFKSLGDKISKITGLSEAKFYEDLYKKPSDNFSEKDAEIMKGFIPKYFGRENTENEAKPKVFLENLLIDKEFGSLLDIKLGSKGWLDSSKPKKILAEMAKCRISTSEELGFRVTGMVIKDKAGKITTNIKGKNAYLNIDKDNLNFNLKKFLFSNESKELNKAALYFYIDYMKKLETFLEDKCKLKFIAISLFFILDNTKNTYDVKLIDFSYWEKADQKDDNIINGIKSLRNKFEDFLN